MNASDILKAADNHMSGRAQTYDSPGGERSAPRAAAIFNAWTGKDLTPADIIRVLIAVKMTRQQQSPRHQDTIEDLPAYFALLGEECLATKTGFQTCPNCGAENTEWKPEPGGEIKCFQCCAQYILPSNPEDKTHWSYKPISNEEAIAKAMATQYCVTEPVVEVTAKHAKADLCPVCSGKGDDQDCPVCVSGSMP